MYSVFGFLAPRGLFPFFLFGQNSFSSYDFRPDIIEVSKIKMIMPDVLLKRQSISSRLHAFNATKQSMSSLDMEILANQNICNQLIS